MKKKQTLGTFISKNIIYIAFVIMLIGLSVFRSLFLGIKIVVFVVEEPGQCSSTGYCRRRSVHGHDVCDHWRRH